MIYRGFDIRQDCNKELETVFFATENGREMFGHVKTLEGMQLLIDKELSARREADRAENERNYRR